MGCLGEEHLDHWTIGSSLLCRAIVFGFARTLHGVACGMQPLQKLLGSRSVVIWPICVGQAFSFSFFF